MARKELSLATVVVLGAGASRGASEMRRNTKLECLSPLNADFFTQLQRITASKHQRTIERVIDDVIELFGSNFSLTLEDYFTQLEFLVRAVGFATRNPAYRRQDYIGKRERLMAALSAVLEASTGAIISMEGCKLHRRLIEHLTPEDTIISFNYDCLIDDSLRHVGEGKWNPRWGYGFPLRGYRLEGGAYWTPDAPATKRDESIRLLKLHGSLNWQLPEGEDREIRLKQRLHQQKGIPRFTIVPPVWNKAVESNTIFAGIWREAARRLRSARIVTMIGFSFVPTDLYAQSLFRIALGRPGSSKLKRLIIANPDHEARVRIREVFDVPLMSDGVLVRQFEDFKEFAESLPDALELL